MITGIYLTGTVYICVKCTVVTYKGNGSKTSAVLVFFILLIIGPPFAYIYNKIFSCLVEN